MELSIKNQLQPMHFRFENTKHKLGVRIWGDRRSFHELHELLSECWDCESDGMSQAEACSHIGVIFYFSYEVRHAFMGDRLLTLDGKPVRDDYGGDMPEDLDNELLDNMGFQYNKVKCSKIEQMLPQLNEMVVNEMI